MFSSPIKVVIGQSHSSKNVLHENNTYHIHKKIVSPLKEEHSISSLSMKVYSIIRSYTISSVVLNLRVNTIQQPKVEYAEGLMKLRVSWGNYEGFNMVSMLDPVNDNPYVVNPTIDKITVDQNVFNIITFPRSISEVRFKNK